MVKKTFHEPTFLLRALNPFISSRTYITIYPDRTFSINIFPLLFILTKIAFFHIIYQLVSQISRDLFFINHSPLAQLVERVAVKAAEGGRHPKASPDYT